VEGKKTLAPVAALSAAAAVDIGGNDMDVLDFMEFLVAILSVSIQKWEEPNIPPGEKLHMAFDFLMSIDQ
jgi:hypothetical protein